MQAAKAGGLTFTRIRADFCISTRARFLKKRRNSVFWNAFPTLNPSVSKTRKASKPKTFQIDCLIEGRDAIEIKWRDATTDGDHIAKERERLQATADAGYKPIRVMFYYTNRTQTIRIQKNLEAEYAKLKGEYHYGAAAWDFVQQTTEVDLKAILERIAKENAEI